MEFGLLQWGAEAGVCVIVAEFFEFEEAVAEFDPAKPFFFSKEGQPGPQDEDGGVAVAKAAVRLAMSSWKVFLSSSWRKRIVRVSMRPSKGGGLRARGGWMG